MSDTGTPAVLTDPATEPEAAHLRNVLRQIRLIAENMGPSEAENLDRILGAVRRALDRPATNGGVIDALTKENGDLQSEILELRERLRQYRDSLIATKVTVDEVRKAERGR